MAKTRKTWLRRGRRPRLVRRRQQLQKPPSPEKEKSLVDRCPDRWKRTLRANHQKLRHQLRVNDVLPGFHSFLTMVEYLRVQGAKQTNNIDQVDQLVDILLTKEKKKFKKFLMALRQQGYAGLAARLAKEAGIVLNTSSGMAMAVAKDVSLTTRAGVPTYHKDAMKEKNMLYYPLIEPLHDAFYEGVIIPFESFVVKSTDVEFQRLMRICEKVIRRKEHPIACKVHLPTQRLQFLHDLQHGYGLWKDALEYQLLREVIVDLHNEGLTLRLEQYEVLLREKGNIILMQCQREFRKCPDLCLKLKADHNTALSTLCRLKSFLVNDVGLKDASFAGFRKGCIELFFRISSESASTALEPLCSHAFRSKLFSMGVRRVTLSGHWVINTDTGHVVFLQSPESLTDHDPEDSAADVTQSTEMTASIAGYSGSLSDLEDVPSPCERVQLNPEEEDAPVFQPSHSIEPQAAPVFLPFHNIERQPAQEDAYSSTLQSESIAQYEENFLPKVEEEAVPDDEGKMKHSSTYTMLHSFRAETWKSLLVRQCPWQQFQKPHSPEREESFDIRWKLTLKANHQNLRHKIRVKDVLPRYRSFLTDVEYLRVQGSDKADNVDQVDQLLRILLTKEKREFKEFLVALWQQGYANSAARLAEEAGVVLNTSSGMATAVDRDVSLAARAGIPSGRRRCRELAEWESDLHEQCRHREEQLGERNRQGQIRLAVERRLQEHEKVKRQLEEEIRRLEESIQRLNKLVTKGNYLLKIASLLAEHRQNCQEQLLPAVNELNKLSEYVVAIVGTTASAVGGAVATGILAVAAPSTFGITGVIAVGTGVATVAVAAGGGVGAQKVRDRMRNVTEARSRTQDWISTDKELCSKMIKGVVEYEESMDNMREMFDDDASMHAFMESEGVARPSEVERRFTQMSTTVVKKWRALKFDPDNVETMAHGRQKAKDTIQQFMSSTSKQQDFSTVTLFLDYEAITDLLLEHAKEKKEKPCVQELVKKIVSDLKTDLKHIQPFAELKSLR